MAQLASRPYPPGRYPLIVIGTGPGGLQLSYSLTRLGVPHATLSADPKPGGMFLRYPLFQRLNTWSKPPALPQRGTRSYHWLDWNSLVADESPQAPLVPEFMDRTSSFPSRQEVVQALSAFAERGHVQVRYNCRWEGTRRSDEGFILATSDGEYHARVVVLAIGMAEPWKPLIPGI